MLEIITQRQVKAGPLLAAMVLLALLMTWPTLNMGLWLDELCSVNDVAYSSASDVIVHMWGRMDDLHPPLSYIPLFACIKLFGLSDLVVRTPPLIFGLLMIPTVYWLGKITHSSRVGLIAAYFATVSPFANYFDCQSRGYSMAAWFTALCLISFIKLVDTTRTNYFKPFIGVVLCTSALCYTEYISVFILPSLGLATIWICLTMLKEPSKKILARTTFIRCLAALTIGFLLFVPWIPSMLIQSGNMNDLKELAPRTYWPLIFSFNLMMMFPIPLIITIPLFCLGLVVVAGILIKRKKLAGLSSHFTKVPPAYAVLLCAVALPSSLIGFLTPWFIGYFRYIYPYTAAGWVLLAVLLCKSLPYAPATLSLDGTQAADDTNQQDNRKANLMLATILSAILGLNVLYIAWFDSRPQSGLRAVARDAQNGKYDNSLILIVPDVIGPTLGYYLAPTERTAHNIKIAGYPRWSDPFTPVAISDLKKQWGPEIVAQAAAEMDKLSSQGFKYLVIAKDSDKQIENLSTATVPRMTRVKALMAVVNKKYKKVTETEYPGITENVTVSTYELQQQQK